MTFRQLRCGIYFHPGVSDGEAIQEYADFSARDMARKEVLASGQDREDVPSAAARAPLGANSGRHG
jgi:hypothetical protein